jgi:hypothetical protein
MKTKYGYYSDDHVVYGEFKAGNPIEDEELLLQLSHD